MGELSPGSTGRRWEPEGGFERHREKIHKDSKFADDHKNLPFQFYKTKRGSRRAWLACVECGRELFESVHTIMCVCPNCKKVTKVERI